MISAPNAGHCIGRIAKWLRPLFGSWYKSYGRCEVASFSNNSSSFEVLFSRMRGFLLVCLVALGSAEELGYNYQPSNLGVGIGPISGIGSTSGIVPSSGNGLLSGSSNLGGFTGLNGGHSNTLNTAPVVTELNKEYYFHSAPEEDFNDLGGVDHASNVLKKNLRVIFIKAPENNGAHKHALQIAKQAVEDKVAIYVLTKQPDASEIQQQVQYIQEIRPSKPEVRFIKYRTPQDALNAQRTIQAQYDALGGSSKSSDEGVAPVLNYASPTAHHSHSGPELVTSGSSSPGSLSLPITVAPKNTYLPSAAF